MIFVRVKRTKELIESNTRSDLKEQNHWQLNIMDTLILNISLVDFFLNFARVNKGECVRS